MRTILLYFSLLAFTLPAQTGTWQTAKSFSATASLTNTAVVAAPDQGFFLSGNFMGTVSFDSVTLSSPTQTGYLLKVGCDFKPQWAQKLASSCNNAAVTQTGEVFATGEDFGKTYVVKYDANGNESASFTATGGASKPKLLRTDKEGNCYVAGDLNATATFGDKTLTYGGSRECFLIKLSPDLKTVLWAVFLANSSEIDEVTDLEIDREHGFMYACGNYSQQNKSGYPGDFYVVKHSLATGQQLWQQVFTGGSGTYTMQVLALDPGGETLYTAGGFKNSTNIKGINLSTGAGGGAYHVFLAGMKTLDGSVNWASKVATGDNYPKGMVCTQGKLFIHGAYNSSYGAEIWGSFSLFSDNPFLVQLDLGGKVEFAESFTGGGLGSGAPAVPGSGSGNGLDQTPSTLLVSGKRGPVAIMKIGNLSLAAGNNSIYLARKAFGATGAALNASVAVVHPVSCPGEKNGSAVLNIQGGIPPYQYQWPNGGDGTGLAAGTYTVTITDAGCSSVLLPVVIGIDDNIPPTLSCPANVAVCEGEVVVYPPPVASDNCDLGGAQPVLASGLPSGQVFPVGTQIQVFKITDGGGNTSSCSFSVSVAAKPVADAGPDRVLDCQQLSVTLGGNSSSGPGITCFWTGPGIGVGNQNQKTPVVNAAGAYTLVVTNAAYGCTASDTVMVSTGSGGALTAAEAGPDQSICSDGVLLGSNLPAGCTGVWTAPDGVTVDNPLSTLAEATGLNPGVNLFVWTLSGSLCPDYDADTVAVFFEKEAPLATDDMATVPYGTSGITLNLLENDQLAGFLEISTPVVEIPDTNVSWSLHGDGALEVHADPHFSGLVSGRYILCSANCPALCDTAFLQIEFAEPDFSEGPPNVITPNGDGLNERLIFDQLDLDPQIYAASSIVIVNRWGQVVFEARPYNNDWAGKNMDGTPLPEGSYYYVLRLPAALSPTLQGTVTVLR